MRRVPPAAAPLLAVLLGACVIAAAGAVCGPSCQDSQAVALQQLYADLDGARWARQAGWREPTSAAPLCTWDGVACCSDDGLVDGSASMACPLPGGVAGLQLAGNRLSGSWPGDALAALGGSLVALNLRSNSLTGSLPTSIGDDLPALVSLDVGANALSGPLPASLGQLTNLTHLSAGGNALSGPLPASALGCLQSLRWLLLEHNALSGPLPAGLLQLPSLAALSLAYNRLSGPLPNLAAAGARRCALLWGMHVVGIRS
jgi:hypothetical protein